MGKLEDDGGEKQRSRAAAISEKGMRPRKRRDEKERGANGKSTLR